MTLIKIILTYPKIKDKELKIFFHGSMDFLRKFFIKGPFFQGSPKTYLEKKMFLKNPRSCQKFKKKMGGWWT